ncbi:MAG: hypothetical protein COB15_00475 [Flavobacteriales bacterium]|nr:MAG: hypothetical protein COB15_00475 [Flavobacteriales bacterium]
MKKYLLLASTAVFMVAANAQDKSAVVYRDGSSQAKIDNETSTVLIKPTTAPNEKAASADPIGTSWNVFTILGDRQNQVVYNKDINTVGFVHRQNDGVGTSSGIISFDYSTDGGATWTVNPFALTPTLGGGNGNRYPNITMYNPAANTDPTNAYVVVTGPQLLTGTASGANGWGGMFRASAKLDGSNASEKYNILSQATNGDANEWGTAGLFTAANGLVIDATTNIDNNSATLIADNYSNYYINKGTFNAGNNDFDWTADTITPGWHSTMNFTAGMLTNVAGMPNMAWSPDGMTGYMVVMGADSNASMNTMLRPYVMKSTDGGANWANVLDNDFSQNAVLKCYIWPTDLVTPGTEIRPFFSSYDMVVDNNGELRIFAEITSGSNADSDSLFYSYSARQSGFLFEVATNPLATDGSGWDVTFIDSVYVDDYEWDATNGLSHFVRPQASRSQDGTKVFYSWTASDVTLSPSREFPHVAAIGRDVATGLWTTTENLSANTAADYISAYQTVAVETIENNVKDYEIAIVYGCAPGGAPLANGLTAPQWNYISEVGFDNGDFTNNSVPTPTACLTSTFEEELENNTISIYPNPSNGVIEIVTYSNNFNYTVINVVGDVVAQSNVNGFNTTVDLSNNSKGVYFVTINTEKGSTTQKVILSK